MYERFASGFFYSLQEVIVLGGLITGIGAIYAFWSDVRHFGHWLRPNSKTKHVIALVNGHFSEDETVCIHGLYSREPTIEMQGNVELTAEERRRLKRIPIPHINDPHALLINNPSWEEPVHLICRELSYREVLAKTKQPDGSHEPLALVGANAVMVCPERTALLLHRRSSISRTYPDLLHTSGGGYFPKKPGGLGDTTIRDTLNREVKQELETNFVLDKLPHLIIQTEIKTGWIQVAYLGVRISKDQFDNIPPNPNEFEGKPEVVLFKDLYQKLKSADWAPTGKAAVLVWLGLGAPNAGWHARFGEYTAAKLLEEIVKYPHTSKSVRAFSS